jgi:hypothetical protein
VQPRWNKFPPLVQAAHPAADVIAHHAPQRDGFGRGHMNLEPAALQRGRRFQADEGCAHEGNAPRPSGGIDDRIRIALVAHIRARKAFDRQTYRLGACRDNERIVSSLARRNPIPNGRSRGEI